MKFLIIGDIVAQPGRKAISETLPQLRQELNPDLVIANVENLAHGRGITKVTLDEMHLHGVEFFTGGDHIFWQRELLNEFSDLPLVRPANYPEGTPGNGYKILDIGKNGKVLIINLMGRTSFGGTATYLNCPFRTADLILEEVSSHNDISHTIIDFHAEATSEKYAFAFYMDGRANIVYGTHTHVPTCDQRVLPRGTYYVSDIGMTGNIDTVLGVRTEIVQQVFLTAQNQKFEWEEQGQKAFRSIFVDTEQKTIERVDRYL